LKLAYAQFEELETFARFGAHLDADTAKSINHGQRIRACLIQTEFSPVSAVEQIAVLLALSAEQFDAVPLDQMIAAQQAVQTAALEMPPKVKARLEGTETLSDADRKAIIEITKKALESFQPKVDSAENL
jgi:F-type H+-transporting ATPase subunit alpha